VSWSDGKSKLLEDKLNDFIIGLIKSADYWRKKRLKWARQREAEAERRRICEEQERQRKIKLKRLQELENQAQQWAKCQQIRKYINYVEEAASKRKLPPDEQQRLSEWTAWANQHADRYDPMKAEIPVYLTFDDPKDCHDDE
jgi:hypothetical protein